MGHVSYIVNSTSYSIEGDGLHVEPSAKYIEENRKWRTGTIFELDFGRHGNSRFAAHLVDSAQRVHTEGYNILSHRDSTTPFRDAMFEMYKRGFTKHSSEADYPAGVRMALQGEYAPHVRREHRLGLIPPQ